MFRFVLFAMLGGQHVAASLTLTNIYRRVFSSLSILNIN